MNEKSFKHKHTPIRSCVICKQHFPKNKLLRYAYTILKKDKSTKKIIQSEAQIDIKQCLPGRGWYVCSKNICQESFNKRQARQGARG